MLNLLDAKYYTKLMQMKCYVGIVIGSKYSGVI